MTIYSKEKNLYTGNRKSQTEKCVRGMSMSIEQIRYFFTVAKCGSMSQACRHLHLTQPTLSRQILNMESELDVVLFSRSNQGVKLTEAGTVLMQEWGKAMENYEKGIEKARLVV